MCGVDDATWIDLPTAKVFATTRWSVIIRAKQDDEARAKQAVGELCQAYWQPVYLCVRHHGYSLHDAQDLTQEFFLQLLKGKWLRHLDEAKGRFRAYLAVALRNFLRDQWRRRWTLRRRLGQEVVSIECNEVEESYAASAYGQITPETLYEKRWATSVLERALNQLKIELRANKTEVFLQHFDTLMVPGSNAALHREIAESQNMTAGALRGALFRWRQRFVTLMREEVGRTVLARTDIDSELKHLQQIFARTL